MSLPRGLDLKSALNATGTERAASQGLGSMARVGRVGQALWYKKTINNLRLFILVAKRAPQNKFYRHSERYKPTKDVMAYAPI